MRASTTPRLRPERMAGRARRYSALSRRYAMMAAYVLGEKVEAIAAEYGVTSELVRHYAAMEGISRPRGRQKKAKG